MIGSLLVWQSSTGHNSTYFNTNYWKINIHKPDTIKGLRFPIPDPEPTPFDGTISRNLFLSLPSNIQSSLVYDPVTNQYVFRRSLGSLDFRRPQYMDYNEYKEYDFNKALMRYWHTRGREANIQREFSLLNPKLYFGGEVFNKIFGDSIIEIKTQGSAELIFGLNIHRTHDPTLPENLQRSITFDFDEKIQMSVSGKIGNKMDMKITYNTEATFDFENQTKIAYKGDEDEIIQTIEAGNVTLPLSGSLITGSHSLFGFKTKLKFGRLNITTVISQQKGESQVIEVQGGAMVQDFEISAADYEANRHFFLNSYFMKRYDEALKNPAIINSAVQITKIEVWVTNKTSRFEESRNILALLDLAETARDASAVYPSPAFITYNPAEFYPSNLQNNLYEQMTTTYAGVRDINHISSVLQPLADQYNFVAGEDYEKLENARKLSPSEFQLHPRLGYISLRSALRNDEVLAVAFEYIVDGKKYQVGELATSSVGAPKTLIIKLLKGTQLSPKLPTWDLMMKNIYAIGAYQVNKEDFNLQVLYQNDKTGIAINYLPVGEQAPNGINGVPLLKVLNLDQLDNQLDAKPDGVFDFIDGITIIPSSGKIIFPVLQPFGKLLRQKINNDVAAEPYVFQELYDSTQSKAKEIAAKNKFLLKGSYKSSSGSEIMLNAMNIPEGSVVVTAGGVKLAENSQYIVDYTLGRVTITDQSILESGTPIQISLENNSAFNLQTKTLFGTHLDYEFSDDFTLGGTIMNLSEKPFTTKVAFGDEPISNTIWGLDGSYRTDVPFLTRLIDFIPGLSTKEMSSISLEAEFAHLIPGHASAIKQGVSYIDDFESSKKPINLRSPHAWMMASTPQGQPTLFKEASLNNQLAYGYNRAKLAWFTITSDFLRNRSTTPQHIKDDVDQQSNHFVREIFETEIFPNKESETGYPHAIPILNFSYYPSEKGPYNYDVTPNEFSAGIDEQGRLNHPEERWAGVMRKVDINDFEAANVEYIEFWLMDPFVNETSEGGNLYFNLGNISEDVLKDSRKSFENGLPITEEAILVDTTAWGRVPIAQSLIDAFDNNAQSRQYQDVGLDGLSNVDEQSFFGDYIQAVANAYGVSSPAYIAAQNDPSNDDYHFYRGSDYDAEKTSILNRYKFFNGFDGNSPTADQSGESYPTSATLLPDKEDINRDNTLSDTESYYQYKLSIRPQDMQVGKNYITDMIEATVTLKNKEEAKVKWYQFKIPVREPSKVVGSIPDFKSIRFMRMFLRGFKQPIFLRMASLDLVRGDWRKYNLSLEEGSEHVVDDNVSSTSVEVSVVNIEENSAKSPVNYVLPPGGTREIDPYNPQMRQLNEQSLVLKIKGLEDGDARAVYRNVNIDMRQYKKLQMYSHAEQISDEFPLEEGELRAFVRLGSDYRENYYEYEIVLKLTATGVYNDDSEADRFMVWPEENNFVITFEDLQRVKQERNNEMRREGSTLSTSSPYRSAGSDGNSRITIVGNPNLSNIKTIMLGVRNPSRNANSSQDDGLEKSVEVWFNELRLTDFNEEGGWAANARVVTRFADFATVTLAGQISKPGFGSIEKKVNERSKEEVKQYDFSSNIQLGNFFPKDYGVRIPMYIGYSESFSTPQYNPLDPDIPLDITLADDNIPQAERDSIRQIAQDYLKRRSINFTNVKINTLKRKDDTKEVKPGANIKYPWSISNFSVSYAFTETYMSNITTQYDVNRRHTGSFSYNYTGRTKPVMPFKRMRSLNSPYFRIIKDINFFYFPQMIAFRSEVMRSYHEKQLRNISEPGIIIEPTVQKNFTWNRSYDVKYNLSKSIKFDFTANNMARIDEPMGVLDPNDEYYQTRIDTIWQNVYDLGRTTQYTHRLNASYTLPINKIPLFEWVTATARYTANFNWNAGPITTETLNLGNVIKNSHTAQLNGQLNFLNLYNKVDFLKKINSKMKRRGKSSRRKKYENVKYEQTQVKLKAGKSKAIYHKLGTKDVSVKVITAKGQTIKGELKIVNDEKIRFTAEKDYKDVKITVTGKVEQKEGVLQKTGEFIVGILMGVKNVALSYSQTDGSILPGYLPKTKNFGLQTINDIYAPGIPFVVGLQDPLFAQHAAENGWISNDTTLNTPHTMTHLSNLNFRSTIEPIAGLRIELSATRSFSENKTEYWKADRDGLFAPTSTNFGGNFSMSFFSLPTSFWETDDKTYDSRAYENLKDYRMEIAWRLANARTDAGYNPNAPNIDSETGKEVYPGYPNGYSPISQDVLIPAFLAAYSNQSPTAVSLDLFPKVPNLNWRVNYDFRPSTKKAQKLFKSISFSHAYRSTYNIGSYVNSFYEFKPYLGDDGFSYLRDDLGIFFLPQNQINSISITEQFGPLLGLDITWASNLSTRFEWKKNRNLTLSFSNGQLTEMTNNEFVIGAGMRIEKLPIIIKAGGKTNKFESDLNIRADFSLRNNLTVLRKLIEDVNQATAGQTNISVKISADYSLNDRFNIRMFYDQSIIDPKVATSYRNSNIKFGVSVRFTLIP